ncbi:MAG: hypothetical protein GXY91_03090 [Clostridia bacterium]|nr:hypothetical protein [Clostridia bacterium]
MPPGLRDVFLGLVLWILFVIIFENFFSLSGSLILGLLITLLTYIYYFSILKERRKKKTDLEKKVLDKLPVGIVVLNSNQEIVWCNLQFKKIIDRKEFLTGKLGRYLPGLQFRKHSSIQGSLTQEISIKDKIYQVNILPLDSDLRLVFLKDITEQAVFVHKNMVEGMVLGIIQVDNYPEVLESIEEEKKPLVLAEVDKLIGDWAQERDAFLKKFAEDRYLVFLTWEALGQGMDSKFAILDKVRNVTTDQNPITLSMGFGVLGESLIDLGRLATLALELATGRGGDQAVVKSPDKVWFYGGKTQAPEKRTKVKTRVMAHSLQNLILEAKNVIIMGHQEADFDSLGASIGLAAAVEKMGVIPYLVVEEKSEPLERLFEVLGSENLQLNFLFPGEAKRKIDTCNSLLIIVDTHRPGMVPDQELLSLVKKIAVIDHHRRGEEFIDNVSLVYLEPYASSVSELVTELIQYFDFPSEIDKTAATALLAGITVDTKNFIFQAGVRTFESASYLRRLGAEPVQVQKLLKDNLDSIKKKAIIIENCQVLKDKIAVSFYPEPTPEAKIIAAGGADALLNIEGIEVSFVLCPLTNKSIALSARSSGKNNVQVLMEQLGGGGHLTVAGAQLNNVTLAEAREVLMELIEENFSGEE